MKARRLMFIILAALTIALAVGIGLVIDNATITTGEFSDAMEQGMKNYQEQVDKATGIIDIWP